MKKIIITIMLLLSMTTQVMAKFYYSKDVDRFSGKDISHVSIYSLHYWDHTRKSSNIALLYWKCFGDELNIIISHVLYQYRDEHGKVAVLYKFDDETSFTEHRFYLSIDQEQIYFDKDKISTFTKKALLSDEVKMLVIDTGRHQEKPSRFKLKGLGEELKKLQCAKHLL